MVSSSTGRIRHSSPVLEKRLPTRSARLRSSALPVVARDGLRHFKRERVDHGDLHQKRLHVPAPLPDDLLVEIAHKRPSDARLQRRPVLRALLKLAHEVFQHHGVSPGQRKPRPDALAGQLQPGGRAIRRQLALRRAQLLLGNDEDARLKPQRGKPRRQRRPADHDHAIPLFAGHLNDLPLKKRAFHALHIVQHHIPGRVACPKRLKHMPLRVVQADPCRRIAIQHPLHRARFSKARRAVDVYVCVRNHRFPQLSNRLPRELILPVHKPSPL